MSEANVDARNRVVAVALPLLSFGALFLLLDVSDIITLIGQLGVGAIVALVLVSGLRPVVGGIRSTVAFRPIRELSLFDATKGYVLSAYGTIFLPSALGGDLFRIEHMKNVTGTSRSESFLVAATERVSGLFSLLFLTICVFFFDVPLDVPWLWFAGGLVLCVVVLLYSRHVFSTADKSSTAYRVLSYTREYANKKMLIAVFALSVLFQVVSLSVPVLVAYELAGFNAAVMIALVTPAIALFSALPISIGGLGLREASYVGAGALLGVDESVCLISGLALSVSIVLSGLPGVFIQRELFPNQNHGDE